MDKNRRGRRPHLPPERPHPARWPVGEEEITLTLTANAGVLVCWRGHKLLVDGLHGGEEHAFSPVPAPMLEEILSGRSPFDGISWLAFTHLHSDHFSAAQVGRFLRHFPQVSVLLPPGAGISALEGELKGHGARIEILRPIPDQPVTLSLRADLQLTAFRVQHDGTPSPDIFHCCLLLSLAGRRLLFLGDAVQEPSFFVHMLQGSAVDTLVVNPLFLNRPAGRATVQAIAPEKVVVDHIPFAWEDPRRFREMVARSAARWQSALPPLAVLWDPLDTITI